MKKKIIIFVCIVVIIVLGIVIVTVNNLKQNKTNEDNKENIEENQQDEINDEQKEIPIENQEQTESQEEQTEIDNIKNDSGKTGDSELYEIQESYDNKKVVTIKSSVKYKVAFAGMIKNGEPKLSEVDDILKNNHPKYAGIWIFEKDRQNVLEMLKEITNSEYEINENGYLKIKNKNNQNENDKKIEKVIKGDRLYILRNSSVTYIVDEVTGEILDYNFEEMDQYQTYEYFEDNNKMIIFINENKEKQMSKKEIIQSIIDLM